MFFYQVIDRRVRECNVMSDMLPLSTEASELIEKGYYKLVGIFINPVHLNFLSIHTSAFFMK